MWDPTSVPMYHWVADLHEEIEKLSKIFGSAESPLLPMAGSELVHPRLSPSPSQSRSLQPCPAVDYSVVQSWRPESAREAHLLSIVEKVHHAWLEQYYVIAQLTKTVEQQQRAVEIAQSAERFLKKQLVKLETALRQSGGTYPLDAESRTQQPYARDWVPFSRTTDRVRSSSPRGGRTGPKAWPKNLRAGGPSAEKRKQPCLRGPPYWMTKAGAGSTSAPLRGESSYAHGESTEESGGGAFPSFRSKPSLSEEIVLDTCRLPQPYMSPYAMQQPSQESTARTPTGIGTSNSHRRCTSTERVREVMQTIGFLGGSPSQRRASDVYEEPSQTVNIIPSSPSMADSSGWGSPTVLQKCKDLLTVSDSPQRNIARAIANERTRQQQQQHAGANGAPERQQSVSPSEKVNIDLKLTTLRDLILQARH